VALLLELLLLLLVAAEVGCDVTLGEFPECLSEGVGELFIAADSSVDVDAEIVEEFEEVELNKVSPLLSVLIDFVSL
jgi:hypothetical protein